MNYSGLKFGINPSALMSLALCSLIAVLGLVGCGGGGGGSDDKPSLSINSPTVVEGDTGSVELVFTITLSEDADSALTVDYATSDGTATAGTDYESSTGTVTIAAGDINASVSITIIGDGDIEDNETLNLTIDNVQGVELAQSSYSVEGTIENDDHADPKGFYDVGNATINDPANVNNDLVLSDLRAMIADDRIMIMSNANAILYDADITNIAGNAFTADVEIYYGMEITNQAGLPPDVINTTMTGMITEGSQLTATVEGTGIGSGSFSLTYSQTNSTQAELVNIEKRWNGDINTVSQSSLSELEIKTGGVVEVDGLDQFIDGLFAGCEMTGTAIPIANSTLFNMSINVTPTTCGGIQGIQEGDHTGLATTLDANHDKLIIMFSNAVVAGMAEWDVVP